MTKPWGDWTHSADPAILPESSTKSRLHYVCKCTRYMIKVYPLPEESDNLCVATWNAPVHFEPPYYTVLLNEQHVGIIPQHIVDYDQLTGEPIVGSNIGGTISTQCRCGNKYSIHTRTIENAWQTGVRGRVVMVPQTELKM